MERGDILWHTRTWEEQRTIKRNEQLTEKEEKKKKKRKERMKVPPGGERGRKVSGGCEAATRALLLMYI